MSTIELFNQSLVRSFDKVLESFVSGEEYKSQPPQGPPNNLPTLTAPELANLQRTVYGEDLNTTGYAYSELQLIEDAKPVEIVFPDAATLNGTNICGIDGSNQRIERGAFYLIIARTAIVNFKYSKEGFKPYFYNASKDACCVIWVDGNVFNNDILLHTKVINGQQDKSYSIIGELTDTSVPFLFKYDPSSSTKSPSSHALGWGVKIQQALELDCLKQVKLTERTVCIKDGPLFSTSVTPKDVIDGLAPIYEWQKQTLVACSKSVKDSTMLIESLLRNTDLRNYWFKDQNITDSTLKSIATDLLLLPRILKPGFRTPLMVAVPVARSGIVKTEPRLKPLSCYYLSKSKPHTYIRLEIPWFMHERDKKQVEEAINIVAWQHELGHSAPLVQIAANERCQLISEKNILEMQTVAALNKNKLEFPQEI